MNLLLDTHVLLWWLKNPDELKIEARNAIRDPRNTVYYSAVNIWEIVIKSALGKLPPLEQTLAERALLDDGIGAVSISPAHAWEVMKLPRHHNDPFDRLLVAQARKERLTFLTRDPAIVAYDIDRIDA